LDTKKLEYARLRQWKQKPRNEAIGCLTPIPPRSVRLREIPPACEVNMVTDSKAFLTVPEVADFLRVQVSWVYQHVTASGEGRLPGHKIGKYWRFRPEEVLAWVEGKKV
jgi:excisionase family DNA binding protein